MQSSVERCEVAVAAAVSVLRTAAAAVSSCPWLPGLLVTLHGRLVSIVSSSISCASACCLHGCPRCRWTYDCLRHGVQMQLHGPSSCCTPCHAVSALPQPSQMHGQAVAELMGKDLDIKSGHRVTKVDYGGSGVQVSCENGAVLDADYVVCTVSLGVLKVRLTGPSTVCSMLLLLTSGPGSSLVVPKLQNQGCLLIYQPECRHLQACCGLDAPKLAPPPRAVC